MDLNKPIGEQLSATTGNIQQGLSETAASASATATNTLENISNSVRDLRGTVENSVKDFSPTAAGNEFMQSNSIVSKFVFLVLVLVAFMILLNTGIKIIAYLLTPSRTPYIVKGMIGGNSRRVISQDPSKSDAITIYRSNNQETGMEFTWNVWLKVDGVGVDDTRDHIFSKGGNGRTATSGNWKGTMNANAPGLYLDKDKNILIFKMDGQTSATNITTQIPNIPMKRWFNVSIRLENKILDIYINGTVAKRVVFDSVPKQNYDDIFVCYNGGFQGSLSNLRYYDRALNVFQINNIVMAGPNLSAADDSDNPKTFDYLSGRWFSMS
jgi:hypothetical protein